MKRYSFFLALAILVVSFGLANGEKVDLELAASSGLFIHPTTGDTNIVPGATVVFAMRYDNTGGINETGITNGFEVYRDDDGNEMYDAGGTFTGLSGTLNPAYPWGGQIGGFFDFFDPILTNVDGVDADTIAFGGLASFLPGTTGLPADFNDVAVYIHTGNIPEFGVLCIDSSFYPNTGTWKWAPAGVAPDWDGPFCFEAITPPCLPPNFTTAPTSVTASHCGMITVDFDAELHPDDNSGGALEYLASVGNIDANGTWTYAPSIGDVGTMSVTISASNGGCQTDVVLNVNITNEAPVVTSCAPKAMSTGVKDFQMTATDDCDVATFSWSVVNYGGTAGGATIDPNTGLLTINESISTAEAGVPYYEVEVAVSDGEATGSCIFELTVNAGSDYQVVIDCVGSPSGDVFQGQHVTVPVSLTSAVGFIGGYDLLIAYDNSALSFQSAEFGADFDTWEYLTYRFGADGNCSNACPSGLLRVVGIAETNNGADHPEFVNLTGTLFNLDFLVTNDRTFQCQNIPLRFYWLDCGDNTLSNQDGTELFLVESILDGYDSDPGSATGLQEIFDPTSGVYPTYFGAQEDCDNGFKVDATRAVSFQSGCVFIACADEIDDRGDINLNGIDNEIADAVLYSNYFVYGLGVFNPTTIEGSIAASDVNADGIALSVADLVYLIRVIIGDALPYAKLAPVATEVSTRNGVVTVSDEMGAAVLVADGNVVPELLVNNMDMIYAYDAVSNSTRILVYSMNQDATFSGEFVNVNGNVNSVEFATYEGATVSAKLLPGDFELAQNYPNPFNPTTTVGFSIPVQSDVNLTIYNVTGQKVTSFSGNYQAGNHTIEWDASNQASGIYFYKLTAGDFEATKKMVLLK